MWTVHGDFFPKSTVWKGRQGKSNFIVEKSENTPTRQVIEVNINGDK